MPESIRDRIFESYFTTKPVGVGTGIGLSISSSIVERHNGNIWFEEVPPSGARFVVELPAIAAATLADRRDPACIERRLRQALIIDDEPDVAGSLADILELMGVKSRYWRPGHSAAEVLAVPCEPDIVFSDLRMPGTNGIAIYRELLCRTAWAGARFVLVTGDMIGARPRSRRCRRHLRPQILEKPFSTLDVRGVLAAITDQVAVASRSARRRAQVRPAWPEYQ